MNIRQVSEHLDRVIKPGQPADWDNTGILIDTGHTSDKILLTMDITGDVVDECIEKGIRLVVSYHPVIFTGLKRLVKDDLVLRLIQHGVSVCCPHTTWDHWMNEYLYRKFNDGTFRDNTGSNELSVKAIVERCKELTKADMIRVVLGHGQSMSTVLSNMVVGVGASFTYHSYKHTVIITGEMSHHCLLASARSHNTVVLLEHSNSERIALEKVLQMMRSSFPGVDVCISEADKDPVTIV